MSQILITGATGRHGGTGAYVARRLRQEGHQVRVLARTRDNRSTALETEGFEVMIGDLRERNSLLSAMEGVDQATFCFPVGAGIVEAAASFTSALRKVSPHARVVVMSMGAAQESSPSHLGRAAWLAEEIMASSGLKLRVLRVAAMFYENILLLHGASIRERGVIRNSFGDAQIPWIAGEDAAELMVAALLDPDRFGEQPVCYPPGTEVLSHAQIADSISTALSGNIRYEAISAEAWRIELAALAERGHPSLNEDMARHISTLGAAYSQRPGAQPAAVTGALAMQLGREAIPFLDFIQAHRDQLTK
jgi:uncharacterized protein YbjT (DUF2867 family)